jgi:hypothetical protein
MQIAAADTEEGQVTRVTWVADAAAGKPAVRSTRDLDRRG